MKLIKFLLLIIGLFLLVGGITCIIYTQYNVVKVQEFDMVAFVELGSAGLGFNGSQLMFGKVSPGNGVGIRNLLMKNNASFPVVVRFTPRGNISQFVSTEEIAPVLKPHTQKKIKVFFKPSESAEQGRYCGTLRAVLSRN